MPEPVFPAPAPSLLMINFLRFGESWANLFCMGKVLKVCAEIRILSYSTHMRLAKYSIFGTLDGRFMVIF